MVDGVRRIIDVRSNPIARRYGFHKSTLQRLANYVGIDYQHQPTLGISPQERKDVTSKLQYDALFRRYEFKTLKQQSIAVESVSKSIAKTPSTLLCMERDPACCHRSRLANKLSQISGLPIKHLTSND